MAYAERKTALDAAVALLDATGFDRITVTDTDRDPTTGTGRVHRATPAFMNDGGYSMCIEVLAPTGTTCVKISNTTPVRYSVTSTYSEEMDRVKDILGVSRGLAPAFELQR